MLEEHELHFELGAGRTPCGGCRACNTKQRGGGLGAPAGGLPRQGWAPCRWPGYRGQRGGICLRLLKHGGQSGFPPLLPGLTASPGQGTARPGAARPVSPPLPAAAGRDRGGLRRAGEPPVARGMAARNPGTELGKGLGPRGGQGRGETTRGGGGPASGLPSGSLPPRLRAPWGRLPSRLPPVASRGLRGSPCCPQSGKRGPVVEGRGAAGLCARCRSGFPRTLVSSVRKGGGGGCPPAAPCLPAWRGSGTAEPVGRVDMACSRAGSPPVPLPAKPFVAVVLFSLSLPQEFQSTFD